MNDSSFGTQILSLPLLLVLLALALPAVVLVYRRDLRMLPKRSGQVLVGLRLCFVFLLFTLAADPVYTHRETVREKGMLLVILDTSGSSALKDPHRDDATKLSEARALSLVDDDGEGALPPVALPHAPGVAGAVESVSNATRLELMEKSLASGTFAILKQRFRVLVSSIAGVVVPLGDLQSGQLEIPPPGGTTDLGAPLAAEVMARKRDNLDGVLLFSDGNHHAPEDPREVLTPLRQLGVPLICVGVGALEKPKDLAVSEIDATGKVFAGDEIRAQIVIDAARFPALELPLRVEENGKPIKDFTVSIPAGERTVRVPVSFSAGQPGRRKFTFSLPVQPGEVESANNRRDLWVEVLSDKAKVLLLDGSPRWEWRYLKETWRRDENVDVEVCLVTPAPHNRLPEGYPPTREVLFGFDVVVIGDVPPHVFSRAQKDDLHDFVTQQGGTLVLVAGPRYLPYAWLDTPIAAILPVEPLEPVPPPGLGASIGRDGFQLALTSTGERSVITRLLPGLERNNELWELLPEHYWLNPIRSVTEGADVLVTVSKAAISRLPGADAAELRDATASRVREEFLRARGAILVTHSYGAGRVLYTGIDSAWRWRYRLGDELYGRFWGQVVRWAVTERLNVEDPYVRLGTGDLLYRSDSRVTIDALIRDRQGNAFQGNQVTAVISGALDRPPARVPLRAIPRSSGRFQGAFDVTDRAALPDAEPEVGSRFKEYRVHLEIPALPGYADLTDKATVPFIVLPSLDEERHDTVCNVDLLGDISALTSGTFLPLSRLPEVTQHLREKPREREVVVTTAAWDYPLPVACVLLVLLAAEWILRKRRDLV